MTLKNLKPDPLFIRRLLEEMLAIPSPTGMTEGVVHYVCNRLDELGIAYELTRLGAIRATLPGRMDLPKRAVVGHLDTLGAMVRRLGERGRPAIVPVGHWSARFAEGARVTVFTDNGRRIRGTILPLKASGHVFGDEIDSQPSAWDNLEIRLDETSDGLADIEKLGIQVGDMVAIDTGCEILDNGFINSRHLDNKAGVAAVLAAVSALQHAGITPPMTCHLLFTIAEEVGVGASHILHGDVAEMVAVDNGTLAPGQNTHPTGVTLAMLDSNGPFDRHLTGLLLKLCQRFRIPHARDVFRHYRSDAASALEAGNDIRTALVCFALDGSHGWERTHMDSLLAMSRLLTLYMQCPPLFERDKILLGPVLDFPNPLEGDEDPPAP